LNDIEISKYEFEEVEEIQWNYQKEVE
jgi:hypothetical protein